MYHMEDQNKALQISAVITEWEGNKEVKIENVPAPVYEHQRVKITTDVGETIVVSAWDVIRAVKACAGFSSDD